MRTCSGRRKACLRPLPPRTRPAGNATAALSAAAELPHIGLVEALELCLLLGDDGAKFERAIVRWHARYATETAGVTVNEAQAVLALLAALRGPRADVAARSLAELVYRRGLERASELLIGWANEADGIDSRDQDVSKARSDAKRGKRSRR